MIIPFSYNHTPLPNPYWYNTFYFNKRKAIDFFITYNDNGIVECCELICGTPLAPTNIPEDFSFSLVWNCYGISSYDSQTGKLVKTTDATNPKDYITYYQLTDEDKEYIYNLPVWLS